MNIFYLDPDPKKAAQYHCDKKDVVLAYRNYYKGGKAHIAKWSKREKPEWYNV